MDKMSVFIYKYYFFYLNRFIDNESLLIFKNNGSPLRWNLFLYINYWL